MKNNSTNFSKIISFRKNHVILIDMKKPKDKSMVLRYGNSKIDNFVPYMGDNKWMDIKEENSLKWERLAILLALADGWEPYGEYINRKWSDK